MDAENVPCECQVCGKRYVVETEFLSASSLRVGEDGVQRALASCGKHSGEEIRAVWERDHPA